MENKKYKSLKTIIILFLIFIGIPWSIPSLPSSKINMIEKYKKKCNNDLKKIEYCIKTFNQDYDTPAEMQIHTFDEKKVIEIGENKNIFFINPIIPQKDTTKTFYWTNKCEYISKGDLSENGLIYCKYHGSAPQDYNDKSIISPSTEYLSDLRKEEIIYYSPIILVVIIIILTAIFM